LLVLHGGPGLDHHEFADYLDPLTERGVRLVLVDQRACGRSSRPPPATWRLERYAQDVVMLARALGLERYAVLGHSFGAFVALQAAVDFPGTSAATVISGGVPSGRFLEHVDDQLRVFEPVALRDRVAAAWAREPDVSTADGFDRLIRDQMPFHFADPMDPRIEEYLSRTADTVYAPEVLRHFSSGDGGTVDVEDRLDEVDAPVLVLAGRHDRTCPVDASQAIAANVPDAQLLVLEAAGHMTFVEEPEVYVEAVSRFLGWSDD
jgi:proline iminopeptidase